MQKLDQALNITPDEVGILSHLKQLSHRQKAICHELLRSLTTEFKR
jgi:hypothetical protein